MSEPTAHRRGSANLITVAEHLADKQIHAGEGHFRDARLQVFKVVFELLHLSFAEWRVQQLLFFSCIFIRAHNVKQLLTVLLQPIVVVRARDQHLRLHLLPARTQCCLRLSLALLQHVGANLADANKMGAGETATRHSQLLVQHVHDILGCGREERALAILCVLLAHHVDVRKPLA